MEMLWNLEIGAKIMELDKQTMHFTGIILRSQLAKIYANWLILASFDPNFIISEISVNQMRKYLACMLGGSGRFFFAGPECSLIQ